ncbi:MAG: RDD family protein [Candidatus Heimdallarchaeota archaeon]
MSEKTDKPEKPDVKVALATFNDRFMAGLIDYGIIWAAIVIASILLTIINMVNWHWILDIIFWLFGLVLGLAGIAAFIFLMIYMPYKKDGQSFGKKKQNIKIMVVEDKEKWTIRPVQEGDLLPIILRAIVGWFEVLIIPVVIAWYFITNDKNSQRLADQISNTIVVQVNPETLTPLKKQRTITTKKEEEKPEK